LHVSTRLRRVNTKAVIANSGVLLRSSGKELSVATPTIWCMTESPLPDELP